MHLFFVKGQKRELVSLKKNDDEHYEIKVVMLKNIEII